jgi:poly(A) polymerase
MSAAKSLPAPSHLSDRTWLERPATQAVFAALAARGFEVRAVGGAVRNALLALPVGDVDLATPARPEEVIAAAEAAGLKAVATGLAHGTVTIVSGGQGYQVTTLREDVESYGRHAKVEFTADWAADARRRDFTLNALYCGGDGALFDPLGGWPDLVQRRIRFIGNAGERIREDYLRILRFFRFFAEFGDGLPDEEGLAACVAARAGLACLSGERVRAELWRLLAAPKAAEVVRLMLDYGLIVHVLGLAPRPSILERLAALELALGLTPNPGLRLAALAVETPEDARRLGERLRVSKEEAGLLTGAARTELPLAADTSAASATATLYRAGPKLYRWRLLLAWARSGDAPEASNWRQLWTLPERWQAPRLALSGEDVMALGVPAGPRVGGLLKAVEAWWIAGGFAADRPALLAKLRELSEH